MIVLIRQNKHTVLDKIVGHQVTKHIRLSQVIIRKQVSHMIMYNSDSITNNAVQV